MACQPVHASRSCLGSRLSDRILLRSSRSLQLCRPAGAILALPVGAFHAGDDAGQLFALLGIGGRGDGEREFEQLDFARRDRIELQPVEPRQLLGILHGGGDGALVELGRQGFGVVGDVGGLDPVRACRVDAQDEQLLLHVIDKLAGFLGGRLARRATRQGRQGASKAHHAANRHVYTLARAFCALICGCAGVMLASDYPPDIAGT